jgi:L-threonylcarbamoyladenylate synthase
VLEDLGDSEVDLLLDAGQTFLGIESTVIDVTRDPPVLLRPGPFTVEELRRILGRDVVVPWFARGLGEAEEALSPGMRYRHYSPSTPLLVVECQSPEGAVEVLRRLLREHSDSRVGLILTEETRALLAAEVPVIVVGSRYDAYGIARNLYDALRILDKLNVDLGIAEGIGEEGIGLAIMNRLRKASGRPPVVCGD